MRCACHVLNLVARDGLAVISSALEKIKAIVLVVKNSPLQWEELKKRVVEWVGYKRVCHMMFQLGGIQPILCSGMHCTTSLLL